MKLQRVAFLVGVLALALIVAACGGGGSKSDTSTSSSSSSAGEAVEIAVTLGGGGNEFSITPNNITVSAGQEVRLVLRNEGSLPHDFHITAFDINSPVIPPGGEHVITFTPNRTGEFLMACHEPGHSAMTGTFIVR